MDRLLEFVSNNIVLAAGTVAMALAVIFNELRLKAAGLSAVPAARVVGLINSGSKVVDVRDQESYEKGHIVGSINIPESELADKLSKKLKNAKSIVLVCDSGARSGQLVAKLRKQGNESVYSVQGGIGAWQRDNLPTVAGDDD